MRIFEIKVSHEDGEKPEKKSFLVCCETFGRAEEMAYEVSQSLGYKTFTVEDVVQKKIKEVIKSLDPDETMWLVKYEFGLEAKPTKSNILVSGKFLSDAHSSACEFLSPLTDGLFITDINKTAFIDYVEDSTDFRDAAKKLKDFIAANNLDVFASTVVNGVEEHFQL
jgi:hypothetical protein